MSDPEIPAALAPAVAFTLLHSEFNLMGALAYLYEWERGAI